MLYLIIGFILLIVIIGAFKSDQPGCGCLILFLLILLIMLRFFPIALKYLLDLLRLLWYLIKDLISSVVGDTFSSFWSWATDFFNKLFLISSFLI
ncbi:hypothetical protein HNP81_004159 [Peribacillus huizhouensis]|uniref:Stage III sporulation protein AD n=1 Tax=Peribacillus huizhouensis TaxID=1501239 RepID=A0ABR6CUY5_9BACI|nr:hypothetical protein [Peribacillus huizhouensis]